MTEGQRLELMQKVFDKLEKHSRMNKLEKTLNLKEPQMQQWLESWEGPETEP